LLISRIDISTSDNLIIDEFAFFTSNNVIIDIKNYISTSKKSTYTKIQISAIESSWK